MKPRRCNGLRCLLVALIGRCFERVDAVADACDLAPAGKRQYGDFERMAVTLVSPHPLSFYETVADLE